MRKRFLFLLLLLVPVINDAVSNKLVPDKEGNRDLFSVLNLSEKGLSSKVFQLALKGYRKLETIGKLENSGILTIIDFSQFGLSLILEGIEKGFNDNALKREIILHGAAYATEDFIRKTGRLGRSFGCPSLPPDLIKPVVETIKEGTCLFIYHLDDYYINHSTLLN